MGHVRTCPGGPIWAPDGPIWAHMGPCGPIWAHIGPPGQVLDFRKLSVRFPQTFRKTIWTNFARFGSKSYIFMKFLNDSASFLLEKLKKHIIYKKTLIFHQKSRKFPKNQGKYQKILGIPRDLCGGPMWRPMWRPQDTYMLWLTSSR